MTKLKVFVSVVGVVAAILTFITLLVLGIPWLVVIANQNQCNAFTWAGQPYHREALYACRGVR